MPGTEFSHDRLVQMSLLNVWRRWMDAKGFRLSHEELEELVRRNSRRRPPGMAPTLVEPPRGPLPLQGGAEVPLEFGS